MRHRAPGGPFADPSVMVTQSTRYGLVTEPSKESSHTSLTVGPGWT